MKFILILLNLLSLAEASAVTLNYVASLPVLSNGAMGVAVVPNSNIAYVAIYYNQLMVVDFTDLSNIISNGNFINGDINNRFWKVLAYSRSSDVAIVGTYYGSNIYIGNITSASTIIAVPLTNITQTHTIALGFDDELLFIGGLGGLEVHNIAILNNPTSIFAFLNSSITIESLIVSTNRTMLFAGGTMGLLVLDISNLPNIILLGSYQSEANTEIVSMALANNDNTIFVADLGTNHFQILNVTNPFSSISIIYNSALITRDICCLTLSMDETILYIASSASSNHELFIYNILNMNFPLMETNLILAESGFFTGIASSSNKKILILSNSCNSCPVPYAYIFNITGICSINSECSTPTPICAGSFCHECLNFTHCPHSSPVCNSTYQCEQCTSNSSCVQMGYKYCTPFGNCSNCITNTDCLNSTLSYCDQRYNCAPCIDNSACILFSSSQVCDSGICVQCNSDPDCRSPYPVCVSNKCVECKSSLNCTSLNSTILVCNNNVCQSQSVPFLQNFQNGATKGLNNAISKAELDVITTILFGILVLLILCLIAILFKNKSKVFLDQKNCIFAEKTGIFLLDLQVIFSFILLSVDIIYFGVIPLLFQCSNKSECLAIFYDNLQICLIVPALSIFQYIPWPKLSTVDDENMRMNRKKTQTIILIRQLIYGLIWIIPISLATLQLSQQLDISQSSINYSSELLANLVFLVVTLFLDNTTRDGIINAILWIIRKATGKNPYFYIYHKFLSITSVLKMTKERNLAYSFLDKQKALNKTLSIVSSLQNCTRRIPLQLVVSESGYQLKNDPSRLPTYNYIISETPKNNTNTLVLNKSLETSKLYDLYGEILDIKVPAEAKLIKQTLVVEKMVCYVTVEGSIKRKLDVQHIHAYIKKISRIMPALSKPILIEFNSIENLEGTDPKKITHDRRRKILRKHKK